VAILLSGCGAFLLVFSVLTNIIHVIELMDATNLCRGFAYRNESLRVAYVDEVKLDGKTTTHYSKLVKVDGMDKEKDQVLFFSISVLDSAITHD
jgi:hypothetical protein